MLLTLGYAKNGEYYSHPDRTAIFAGDFINRGSDNRKTIRIIRSMVENNSGKAILGNHEIYAILLSMKDKDKTKLVKMPKGGMLSALKTLEEFKTTAEEWKKHCKWLRSLPFYIDFGPIRIVHACWSHSAIDIINKGKPENWTKKDVFRNLLKKPNHEYSKAIVTLTKGCDLQMPVDLKILNNKSVSPRSFRLRWWEELQGKTFEEISFESKFALPEYTVPQQILPLNPVYPSDAPPVFFGHYSRFDGPFVIKHNICCTDSWIAGSRTLTAYRWCGESELKPENLVQVSEATNI
jgi:hypothetical protein